MQYILSEKEYKELKSKRKLDLGLQKEKLQKLCTKIANELPVHWGWNGPDPKPWGCKITVEEQEGEWYCDNCPVIDICPLESKEFSK